MKIIDSHQHFWQYNPIQHSWINDDMSVIRKDFLPQNLHPILHANHVRGCIAVQADETEVETNFLVELATKNSFIKGVVGFIDLMAVDVEEKLAFYQQFNVVKGYRHILQVQDPSYMLQSNFLRGISALKNVNATYDILIFPKHLSAAIELVKQNPNQFFVIDHIAKPYIKAGLIEEWKKDIQAIAQFKNVFCKISGMVTEADVKQWKPTDFTPYMDVVVQSFGTKRIMFGSDWPVSLVATSYEQTLSIVQQYFSTFSLTEQQDFFSNNAINFYHL